MNKRIEGLSPKEFFERLRKPKNPPSESKYYTDKVWKPKATLDESIINFVLSNHLTPQQFFDYFNENLLPLIEAKLRKQKEDQEKAQKEFAELKRNRDRPENRILSGYLGRIAYPKQFAEIIQNYSREDFVKVRNQILNGKLDWKLGSLKIEFQTWLNSIIDQKTPESEETNTPSLLRRTIHTFRGH